MVPDLNMPYGKMSYFVLFPLFRFSSVIKLRNFDFESHWNTLILFDKKSFGVRFEYVLQKDVWFCFISIVWVHFSHKTEKFRFWRSLKYLNIFWWKKWCQIYRLCSSVNTSDSIIFFNNSNVSQVLSQKLLKNAAIVLTRQTRGTSAQKPYQTLSLGCLQSRW